MHRKRRFWIEVENAEDFTPRERYVLMGAEDFETLQQWLRIQRQHYSLPPVPDIHFWNMVFRSDTPYDA